MSAQIAFMIGTYGALLCCLYACYRIGVEQGWPHGLIELVILIAFVVLFWALESWANHSAPFYTYPAGLFIDPIPQLNLSWFPVANLGPCAQTPSATISASIPISGGCITYCLMWTARQLVGTANWFADPWNAVVAPVLVGVVALLMDAFLDPVLAKSFSCNLPIQLLHPGEGFWTWHTGAHLVDAWFHVPLFNFTSWFASPAILVALVFMMQWFLQLIMHGFVAADPRQGILRAFVLTMVGVIFYVSPTSANNPTEQLILMTVIVLGSVGMLVAKWPTFVRNNPYRWYFVVPLTFYFLFSLLAMLFTQSFAPLTDHLTLFVLGVATAVIGIYFAVSPYWKHPSLP